MQEWLAPPQYLHGISELKTLKVPSDGGQRRRKRQRRSLTNVTSGDAKQQSPNVVAPSGGDFFTALP
jgi:hypothetical protein